MEGSRHPASEPSPETRLSARAPDHGAKAIRPGSDYSDRCLSGRDGRRVVLFLGVPEGVEERGLFFTRHDVDAFPPTNFLT